MLITPFTTLQIVVFPGHAVAVENNRNLSWKTHHFDPERPFEFVIMEASHLEHPRPDATSSAIVERSKFRAVKWCDMWMLHASMPCIFKYIQASFGVFVIHDRFIVHFNRPVVQYLYLLAIMTMPHLHPGDTRVVTTWGSLDTPLSRYSWGPERLQMGFLYTIVVYIYNGV